MAGGGFDLGGYHPLQLVGHGICLRQGHGLGYRGFVLQRRATDALSVQLGKSAVRDGMRDFVVELQPSGNTGRIRFKGKATWASSSKQHANDIPLIRRAKKY